MKKYKIELYVNTKCVHIVHDIDFDFKGCSKEDLIDHLCVCGYVDMRDSSFLYDHLNSWVITEVKQNELY